VFTEKEAAYLRSQKLARFATAAPDGQPDVVAVNFEFDGEVFHIGGLRQRKTVKYRNVLRNPRVALVVDDLESVDPWRPRGIRVYGRADVVQRRGFLGPGDYIRLTPEVKWSWGIEGPVFRDGRFNVEKAKRPPATGGPGAPPERAT
jgi:pyridoxamine 5'-phosphate oxidase family protein